MFVRQIIDEKLAQYAYLVGCPATGEAVVIDPERDVDRYVEAAERHGLRLVAAVETHIHADYLTGLRELAERGVRVYVSDEGGDGWRYEWLIGSDYDYRLLHDGDAFEIGNIVFEAIHTPGHTPEHLSLLVTDAGARAETPLAVATGDFVFVGDLGRPDLLETAAGQSGAMQEGARQLFRSVQRVQEWPAFVQVWPAHGAGSACGKALGDVPLSTVGYELRHNTSIQAAYDEDVFLDFVLSGQPEPPLYFARMKRDNRRGPRLLRALPQPERLSTGALADLAGRTDVAVLDTHTDRDAFMQCHLPASLHAPLDKSFATIAGSYVEEDVPVYLIVEEEQMEEAVRCLVRIGLDDVAGFATPETLEACLAQGDAGSRIEAIDFEQVQQLRAPGDAQVLDVRRQDEYDAGHVPGALHVAHTRLLAHRDELPREATLLVHCASGVRSAAAAALLKRLGHDVRYVADDFHHWADPVTDDQEPAAD